MLKRNLLIIFSLLFFSLFSTAQQFNFENDEVELHDLLIESQIQSRNQESLVDSTHSYRVLNDEIQLNSKSYSSYNIFGELEFIQYFDLDLDGNYYLDAISNYEHENGLLKFADYQRYDDNIEAFRNVRKVEYYYNDLNLSDSTVTSIWVMDQWEIGSAIKNIYDQNILTSQLNYGLGETEGQTVLESRTEYFYAIREQVDSIHSIKFDDENWFDSSYEIHYLNENKQPDSIHQFIYNDQQVELFQSLSYKYDALGNQIEVLYQIPTNAGIENLFVFNLIYEENRLIKQTGQLWNSTLNVWEFNTDFNLFYSEQIPGIQNPGQEFVHLIFENPMVQNKQISYRICQENTSINIFDSSGKLIHHISNSSYGVIDLSSLIPGCYFISFFNTKKVILTKQFQVY